MSVPPEFSSAPRFTRRSSFPILVFVLCFLFGLWVIPWIALPISYAINRGEEKAKADTAIEFFAALEKKSGKPVPLSLEFLAPWVVKRVGPSVVGIKTIGTQRVPLPFQRGIGRGNEGIEHVFGEGSGVIIDKDGYILTNYHVIKAAEAVQIHLSDGRDVEEVFLIGFDQETDLAVLKINVADLIAIEWGDSDRAEVGEPVLAIGNPFGLSHTVTQGIISAKERYNPIPQGPMVQEFLQTDAAINPGNSGGPLVNIRGELIGINTAIYGEAYQGIGFSIPSTLTKKVYEKIREQRGELKHGFLGVDLEPLSKDYAEKNNLEPGKGVVAARIMPKSPAEKGGIEPGDIIVQWEEQPITEPLQLTHKVLLSAPKTEVRVTIVRKGQKMEKTISLGTR